MARPLVPDALWSAVEPLLTPAPPRGRGRPGRPRVPDRACLTGILFVLRTGIRWRDLPREMGCGSGVTCWRRLLEWRRSGVWAAIRARLGIPDPPAATARADAL